MIPLLKRRTLDLNTGDPSALTLNFMVDVCKWMKYLLQSKLDVDSMKSMFSNLAVSLLTILLLCSDMNLIGKLVVSNIDIENGITSVWEDLKSYRVVWESCRLMRGGV